MIYPEKINAKKSDLIIKLLLFFSILVAVILIIINRLTTLDVPWAALANAGIVYIWVVVIFCINRNRTNIAGHIFLQLIAVSLLTYYIDMRLGFKGWSISISIPIMIIISNITMYILTIISYKKFIRYAIYQLLIVLFSMVPIFFIIEQMLQITVLSVTAVGTSILNFLFSLILCAPAFKEVIIRKFDL